MISVPFLRQQNNYSCGAAVVSMILYHNGIKVSLQKIMKDCHVSRISGTTRKNIISTIRKYKLHTHAHSDSSLRELRSFLVKKVPVIVNYREPEHFEGHYGIVVGLTREDVYLQDPYYGPYFKIRISEFNRNWFGFHKSINKRWLLAVSPKKFSTNFCQIKHENKIY